MGEYSLDCFARFVLYAAYMQLCRYLALLALIELFFMTWMRMLTIAAFAEDVSASVYLATLGNGIIFDVMWLVVLLFIPLLVCCALWVLRISPQRKGMMVFHSAVLVLMLALSACAASDLVSWQLYHLPVSIEVFIDMQQQGLWRLLVSGVQLYWPAMFVFMFMTALLFICYLALVRLMHVRRQDHGHEQSYRSLVKRYAIPLLIITSVFIIGKALTLSGYMVKSVDPIVRHGQLSKISYNVMQHIYVSYTDRLSGSSVLFTSYIGDESLSRMFDYAFPDTPQEENIDVLLRVHSQRSQLIKGKPRHVFVILNESYSSWAVTGTHGATHISDDFLALMKKGHLWPLALESGVHTKASLFSIVGGLPYTGEHENYYGTFPTSAVKIFKDLGYHCRFFYGGPSHLANKDVFAESNGFDEYITFADDYTGRHATVEWGVYDHEFYRLVEEHLNDDQPSFNIVLTVGNHLPFQIPVEEHGYDYAAVEYLDDFKPSAYRAKEKIAHTWYSAKYMTQFAKNMCERFPDTIVALTGDHTLRDAPVQNLQAIYKYAVPIGFYGPDILRENGQIHQQIASHQDIIPTLVEMCAPEGYSYPSIGNNLFTSGPQRRLTTGLGTICAAEGLFTKWNAYGVMSVLSPDSTQPERTLSKDTEKLFRARQAVYWYRTRRGPILKYERVSQ